VTKSNNIDISQLTAEENQIFITNFTKQEVYDAIIQIEKNKAPGWNGFPAKFYQKLWDVLKEDLMSMFRAFQDGPLPLFHLNFGTIILLPKKKMQSKFNSFS
jgi:hypothetical protein